MRVRIPALAVTLLSLTGCASAYNAKLGTQARAAIQACPYTTAVAYVACYNAALSEYAAKHRPPLDPFAVKQITTNYAVWAEQVDAGSLTRAQMEANLAQLMADIQAKEVAQEQQQEQINIQRQNAVNGMFYTPLYIPRW